MQQAPYPTQEVVAALHPSGALRRLLSEHSCDVLGHESMGIVEAVGAEVTHIQPGDRVVLPNDRIRQKNP